MKNIKNIIKKALLFTGSTLLLAACSLNVPPPDQFSDPDAITDVNTGRALLTSCYLSYPHQEYELSSWATTSALPTSRERMSKPKTSTTGRTRTSAISRQPYGQRITPVSPTAMYSWSASTRLRPRPQPICRRNRLSRQRRSC